jgi:hypothetical protein
VACCVYNKQGAKERKNEKTSISALVTAAERLSMSKTKKTYSRLANCAPCAAPTHLGLFTFAVLLAVQIALQIERASGGGGTWGAIHQLLRIILNSDS